MNADHPIIDCHVHVFDPARFPYAADVPYRPSGQEVGTPAQLGHLLDAHGVRHALLVGPNSGYNLDNRCMLDAIANSAGRFKGIAVVRSNASRAELEDLKRAGVVGIAFQVQMMGVDFYRDVAPLLDRLRELDLVAQFQVHENQLVALRPMLEDSGVQLVIDHCGRPDPRVRLAQAGFQALLEMATNKRTYVKLSGFNKCSAVAFPYTDAWPYVHALVDAFTPDYLMWGSDWPFLRAPERIDYGPLINLFTRLVTDIDARNTMLWRTPHRLFNFGIEIDL